MHAHGHHASRGFTLVEVLIAMSLSVLLLALLFGALRTYALTNQRGQRHIDVQDNAMITQQFVRQQIQEIVPLVFGRGRQRQVLFSGAPTRMVYVGLIPHHRSPGGLHRNELSVRTIDDAERLVFAFERLAIDDAFSVQTFIETRPTEERELIEADGLSFEYYGTVEGEEEASWHSQWHEKSRIPEVIRINYTHPGLIGNRLVAPIRTRVNLRHAALIAASSKATAPRDLIRAQSKQDEAAEGANLSE